jgi:uncharacterized protein DUF541
MVRIAFLIAVVAAAFPASASAQGFYGPFGQPQEDYGPGITVSGAGLARVPAPAELSEDSIRGAIDSARPRAVARAIADARRRAETIAGAVGVSLGQTDAVELGDGFPERPPCRRSRRTHELRCVAPRFTTAATTVTFEIVGGAGSTEGARELSASATGSAPSEPKRRTSPAIRRALFAARFAATPEAARSARANAELVARGSGLTLGPLFSIVEQSNPYGYNPLLGAFAPGTFCGTVRRAIVRRDPETGIPRVIRRRRVRRCYSQRTFEVRLEATYVAQGN